MGRVMRLSAAAFCFCLLATSAVGSDFFPSEEIKPHSASEASALKGAAERGDAAAELAYGKALIYLQRDPKNHVTMAEARGWLQKAADQNVGEAWYWLGSTSTDSKLADSAYRRAAELGFPPAFGEVFERALFRAGEDANPAEAKHFLDLARKFGVRFDESASGDVARVIEACFEAGSPATPEKDREAIDKDGRAGESFTPNGNMKLAQAYANGWGVKRNPKLALALVCHGADVPAELEAMVDALVETKDDASLKSPFLFCSHVTSGMNGGQCSAFDEDSREKRRDARLVKLAANFTPAQKAAFARLRAAAVAYFDERAGSEQDMSGTARNSIFAEEQGRLRDQFEKQIQAFEQGKPPPRDDFAAADKALNGAYQKLLKNTNWETTGTVSPDSIKKTQRLWLKLRDAWADFGAARYPGSSPDDWKAWATRQRIAQLQDLAL